MNFQCKNCGGNMVYSPEHNEMFCPYCDGTACQEKKGDDSLTVCASCGGEITIDELTSSSKCPYCGNYIVFDKRVSDEYEPKFILPFKISKQKAVECMEEEFGKRTFAPASFLSDKTLVSMNGFYVPFFFYDYDTDSTYIGEGTKVRSWRSGNYDYTETSYYRVERRMRAKYDNIPVDASYAMDDSTMDLMEPYDYAELLKFDPKFMSGFFGEVYNDKEETFEPRAKAKVLSSAESLIRESLSGYSTLRAEVNNTDLAKKDVDYALLPVWMYIYRYGGKTYRYFVNGQNGKVVGVTPVSKLKVFIYGLTFSTLLGLIIELAFSLLGGLL